MTSHRRNGWQWGPFTFRLPFYHTRLVWPEFLQGLLVSTATGLALVPICPTRSHLALAIRNFLSALVAPFFPTQGTLWTGVHVIVVQRWKQGPQVMPDLHSGMMSYYLMGLPIIYFLLPLLTGLKPLLGIALSLTLVLSGFACAYIAMAIPRTATARGTALLVGTALAVFDPWLGLLVGITATLLLVGWERNPDPTHPDDPNAALTGFDT